uniref:Uncharacterized protein n=1 Tax=Meloidogyne enterolobii TaxID=390850 RepID=A0A6V7TXR7_MELEN|nr:unnamed protein product [Meloidogyne enterolobii]
MIFGTLFWFSGIGYNILLKFPTIIKSNEDITIVYYYLNKLFNCSFENGEFKEFIFNPELIQLLFGNARIPKQVYINNECSLSITKHNIENLFQFTSNNLVSKTLHCFLRLETNVMAKYIDDLFKFLTNGGDNFEVVEMKFYTSTGRLDHAINVSMLYDYIGKYIAISRDCSKIVPVIMVYYLSSTRLQLNDKAEKVEIKHLNGNRYTEFQIANVYDPKVKFSFLIGEMNGNGSTFYIQIEKMKD